MVDTKIVGVLQQKKRKKLAWGCKNVFPAQNLQVVGSQTLIERTSLSAFVTEKDILSSASPFQSKRFNCLLPAGHGNNLLKVRP